MHTTFKRRTGISPLGGSPQTTLLGRGLLPPPLAPTAGLPHRWRPAVSRWGGVRRPRPNGGDLRSVAGAGSGDPAPTEAFKRRTGFEHAAHKTHNPERRPPCPSRRRAATMKSP